MTFLQTLCPRIAILGLLVSAASAQATSYTITTSDPGWEFSLDGLTFSPATSAGTFGFLDGRQADGLWPSGISENQTVYFRHQFVLDGPVTSASLQTAFDDDGTVVLNGTTAFVDNNGLAIAMPPVDVTSFLTGATNTITGTGVSTICCGRGWAVIMDVQTAPVPEPSAWALFACGMAGLWPAMRLRRRSRNRDQSVCANV